MQNQYLHWAVAILLLSHFAHGLCVDRRSANLRSGPGKKYKVTWKVYKHMPFKRIKKSGKWYHVQDLDDETHWIHSKLLTSKYRCAVVKVKTANLRSGPGSHYKPSPVYPKAEKYTAFKVLKQKGKWVHLEDIDGDRYWVFRNLLWMP